ncbi:PREDICTED: neuroglian-like [Priapulus caudatus]|uniref:Neuroglian-like n=1 Tax=Priapulus caudatus TaxID=37621 RepID=A0ABM1DUI6_PRICU|nr:PREDICTED: neuroglian-like [Priapulus caudatus]
MCLSGRHKYGHHPGTARSHRQLRLKFVNRPRILSFRKPQAAVFAASAVADKSLRLQIDWRKHGELINYALSQRIIKHPLDHTLLITNTQDDDTADYTCVATAYSRENDGAVLDTVRVTANLTVQSRPNRPGNVILTSCDKRSANVQWTPMGDNRAPILNYIIQFNTTFEPDIWVDLENKVSPTTRQYRVDISPWSNYTFRVIAHNKIGNSVPSDATTVCRTDPDTPDKHPENVRGNGTRPNNMVISWTPMTLLEQNGPGFRYQVKFKRHDDANAVWETVNINEARNNTYIVWGTNVYEPFDIQVKSFNVKGEAPVAVRTYVGFSGEDKPLIQVSNFQLEKVLGPRSASFRWTAVDPTARDINGEFQGYKVQAWVAEEGLENVREVRALPNASSAVLDVLKPYSDVLAQIFVFNAAYDGTPSPAITFRTPEGRE